MPKTLRLHRSPYSGPDSFGGVRAQGLFIVLSFRASAPQRAKNLSRAERDPSSLKGAPQDDSENEKTLGEGAGCVDTPSYLCYKTTVIRAALFDFSGTLADCGAAWWALELSSTASAPLRLLRERSLLSVDDDALAQADHLYREMHLAAKSTGVEISAHDAARQVASALNLNAPDGALDAAVDELFLGCLADVVPTDGALDTLGRLKTQGLLLGVISNARHSRFVFRALERLGMLSFFSTVVVSADVRLRKPRPEIFLNTLADLGVAPAEAAYVGDYYPYDMVGARAAGLRAVWLADPDKRHEDLPADLIIPRLPDLLPWLGQHPRQ